MCPDMIRTLLSRVPCKFIAMCNNKMYPVRLCPGKATGLLVKQRKIFKLFPIKYGMPLGDVVI